MKAFLRLGWFVGGLGVGTEGRVHCKDVSALDNQLEIDVDFTLCKAGSADSGTLCPISGSPFAALGCQEDGRTEQMSPLTAVNIGFLRIHPIRYAFLYLSILPVVQGSLPSICHPFI